MQTFETMWEHAIAEKMTSGCRTREDAVRAIAKTDPTLHRLYLAEFNQTRGRKHAVAQLIEPPPAASAFADPIGEWGQLVAAKMQVCGGNRAAAIRAAVSENPELHQAYVVAYNENRGRGNAARSWSQGR